MLAITSICSPMYCREDWKGAKEAFSRAQGIYVELAKMGSSRDKELYERRLDEIVPVSRLCDHEMKLSGGLATADDAADFNEMIDMQKVEGMDENLRKRLEGMQQVHMSGSGRCSDRLAGRMQRGDRPKQWKNSNSTENPFQSKARPCV